MDRIEIETDFASIRVAAKDDSNEEFLTRHALHQLLKRYRKQYGEEAVKSVLYELEGYYKPSSAYKPVELREEIKPATRAGILNIDPEDFDNRLKKGERE